VPITTGFDITRRSMIVPRYQACALVAAIVAAVHASPYPDKGIVIVDDRSTDGRRDSNPR
jgi:predicted transcriptional regulator